MKKYIFKKTDTPDKTIKKKGMKRKYKIILSIIGVLIVARIILPYVVLHYANKELASLKGYYGHIDDIDISLYRGAYTIENLKLVKLDKKDTFDFVYAKNIDLAIEWRPIFHGELVGKVSIDSSVLIYTQERNDWEDISKDTADFRAVMNSFMPITLNKLEAFNSTVKYVDLSSSPKINLLLGNIHLVALNLVNAYDSSTVLPATIDATGNLCKGNVELHMKMDPFDDQSKFDMNLSLKRIQLPALNDLLRAHANLDVNKGDFQMYSEIATKDGDINGYVKPLIKELDVVSWTKEEGNFRQILWESVVEAGAWVFKNQGKDQLGTKVYIKGKMKDPNVSVGRAIITLLQNAFVKALHPTIDKEINIGTVNGTKEKGNFIDRAIEKRSIRKDRRQSRKQARKAKNNNR